MNIVLLLAHAVEEYDMVKLLSGLGYNVFSIGSYSTPKSPSVNIRPPLPQVQEFPDLIESCHARRIEHAEAGHKTVITVDGLRDSIDWAKADLPDKVLDWADVIICHHFEHTWIVPSWDRLKSSGKRIIWRTVGQSVEHNERMMAPLHREGLQIVRYSPKECNIPGYAGCDALIRFYKDPGEWNGWIGDEIRVINFTQNFKARDPYTNWIFWADATSDIPATEYGPGSQKGELSWEGMQETLRTNRAYLYTGTQPASYTLGLIEAMMTGIPVVSIGPNWMNIFPYSNLLFEGHEITNLWSNDSIEAKHILTRLLTDGEFADEWSVKQRSRAIELFGMDKIASQWKAFLG